ncbi:hypothetical protein MGEO_04315 [Marivita geojedonensis]|uniref:Uncharacterized protein n=1 Tax=Marivita geojedonensis TaxID=1123756 RepID=A0A1X4NPK3_9RHOB|nr:hypothetical protein MGEO_04315 [Marivita geojedonensis]
MEACLAVGLFAGNEPVDVGVREARQPMTQRGLFRQVPRIEHVQPCAITSGQRRRQFHECHVQPIPVRVRWIGIDGDEDALRGWLCACVQYPDGAGAFAQEMHVGTGEEPASGGPMRPFDHKVMPASDHLTDDFDERGSDQQLRFNRNPSVAQRSRARFQLAAMYGDDGFPDFPVTDAGQYRKQPRHVAGAAAVNGGDHGDGCAIGVGKRHDTLQREFIRAVLIADKKDVPETLHGLCSFTQKER